MAAQAAPTNPEVLAETKAAPSASLAGDATGDIDVEGATHIDTGEGAELAKRSDNDDNDKDNIIGKTLVGRYEITRKIGQGGMGAVYEATHKLIGKRVAIKVLLDKYAGRDQIVARLEQEARLASSIGHEHIIDITDFGKTEDGRTFVVMEFLHGQSLGECLSEGPLSQERIVIIAHQIAGALHAAHEKGIVHRDIKPENVFLLERQGGDFVKVVDFGISKSVRTDEEEGENSPRLTQTGMVLGTPLYMSPEQAHGRENLDRRIDVYSLGVIMYEMVTGEVPFRGNNYLSIISQVLNEEPQPPRDLRSEISRELEDIILRALEKEPEDRYQSCEELAADLALLLESYGVTTSRRRITMPRSRRRRRRRKRSGLKVLAWVAGIAGTICAVAVTVYILMSGSQPRVIVQQTSPSVTPAASDAGPSPAKESIDANPEAASAFVEIVSDPEGAVILDNGREIGQAPVKHKLPRKNQRYWLTATLEGYQDKRFWINPFNDETVTVTLEKVPRGGRVIRKVPKPGPGAKEPGKNQGTNENSGTAGGDLSGNPYARPNKKSE